MHNDLHGPKLGENGHKNHFEIPIGLLDYKELEVSNAGGTRGRAMVRMALLAAALDRHLATHQPTFDAAKIGRAHV